jgi:putative transposase
MAALSLLLTWMFYPPSSWYYKPTNGRRGIKPSTDTYRRDGEIVKNELVVEDIKKILGEVDFYGYEKVTWELQTGRLVNFQSCIVIFSIFKSLLSE